MGQKTEFNPDEWDIQDDDVLEYESDISYTQSAIDDDSFVPELLEHLADNGSSTDKEPLDDLQYLDADFFKESSIIVKDPSSLINKSEKEKKIYISHSHSGNQISEQEEEAFRKQIEDLFELLELEKEADKNQGVRVYQTDSSPSKPWRFH